MRCAVASARSSNASPVRRRVVRHALALSGSRLDPSANVGAFEGLDLVHGIAKEISEFDPGSEVIVRAHRAIEHERRHTSASRHKSVPNGGEALPRKAGAGPKGASRPRSYCGEPSPRVRAPIGG